MARTKPTIPVATISDGASPTMSDLLDTGSRGLGGLLSTFEFTDEQWSKLTRWSDKLSQAARGEFKECVVRYLTNEMHSEGAFKSKMDKRDERVRKKIVSLVNDPGWKGVAARLEGLDMVWERRGTLRPPPMDQLVDQSLRILANKLELRELKRRSRSPGPGPKSSQASYKFIADAAALWEKFTGRAATRSDKYGEDFQGFIKDLCGIADPAIGAGTIAGALRRYIGIHHPKGPKRSKANNPKVPKRPW